MSSKIRILSPSLTELAVFPAVSSAARSEKINSDNTLTFSALLKANAAAYINDRNLIGLDNDYFDIAAYKKEQQSDGTLMAAVECEHVSYRLNDSSYNVESFAMTGSPSVILATILNGTGFTVGTVEFSESVTYSVQEAKSRRALLLEFVATLGGEVLFNGFSISVLRQRGSTTPKALLVGKHITVISKSVDKRNTDINGNPTISYACCLLKPMPLALGDVVTLDYDRLDIDVALRIVVIRYDPYNPSNVSIEIGNYANALEDDLYRIETMAVSKDKTYNGCRIGPEFGFEAIRSDKKARAYFRSDGLAFQSGDGSGNWTDKLYYDYDASTGEAVLVFAGTLSAEIINALQTLITPNLYAEKATIAELTVDQLDTSTKVKNFLNSDTSDVNYIKAYDQFVQFITASTDGAAYEQAVNRNGELLYWVDDTHTGTTTEETDLPVYIYSYTEAIKMELYFYDDNGTWVPRITFGAGSGTGDTDKGIVYKDVNGLHILHNEAEIQLSDYVDASLRRLKSCAINRTSGEITVRMEGRTESETISFTEGASGITYTFQDGFTTTVSIS